MSNFKLKHQSKSGLFRHADWHKEMPQRIIPKEVDFNNLRILEESANMRNKEKNRIKYENQELKRRQFEEQKRKFDESMRQHRELIQNLPERVAQPQRLEDIPKYNRLDAYDYKGEIKGGQEKILPYEGIDPTTGKTYDDSEKGRQERLLREQASGMRDEMGYQTSNYEQGGVALMKNNSATPYKLPHQSKAALHNNGGWNSSVGNSDGGLTPDERAEANRLLDSTKNTYMSREFKKQGRFDPELRKVVFENVPMSEEENLAEWDREKGEFYVDFDNDGNAKVLNIPRGDDDIPVQSFIESLDPSQYQGYIPKPEDLPEDYYDPGLDPNSTLNPFKGYQRIKNYRER